MNTTNRGNIKFITKTSIEDFQIVVGESVVNSFPMHIHQKFCIGLIEKGDALLVRHNNSKQLGDGCIYLINPAEAHQIKPSNPEGFSHIVLCFGFNFIGNYFVNDVAKFRFNRSLIYNEKVWKKLIEFKKLILEVPKMDLEYEIMDIFSELYQHYSFSQTDYIDEKKQSDNILKVCSYIRENCKKRLCLQELAVHAGLSKFHFSRVFKKKIGISPYDYQIQSKLKLARDLLLNRQPLADVALELGFTDQSHFNRFFIRNTGVTPRQFIKMNIEL